MPPARLAGFGLVWLALVVFTVTGSGLRGRGRRPIRRPPPPNRPPPYRHADPDPAVGSGDVVGEQRRAVVSHQLQPGQAARGGSGSPPPSMNSLARRRPATSPSARLVVRSVRHQPERVRLSVLGISPVRAHQVDPVPPGVPVRLTVALTPGCRRRSGHGHHRARSRRPSGGASPAAHPEHRRRQAATIAAATDRRARQRGACSTRTRVAAGVAAPPCRRSVRLVTRSGIRLRCGAGVDSARVEQFRELRRRPAGRAGRAGPRCPPTASRQKEHVARCRSYAARSAGDRAPRTYAPSSCSCSHLIPSPPSRPEPSAGAQRVMCTRLDRAGRHAQPGRRLGDRSALVEALDQDLRWAEESRASASATVHASTARSASSRRWRLRHHVGRPPRRPVPTVAARRRSPGCGRW